MKELINYVQSWSPHDDPREQTWWQNMAEERFNWHIEQIKQSGASVSPVKRSLRLLYDKDGHPWLYRYYQRAYVEASPELIEQLRQRKWS